MRAVPVYRVDYARKTRVSIGLVFEKRMKDRARGNFDLLLMARRLFAADAEDAAHIALDIRQPPRAVPWALAEEE